MQETQQVDSTGESLTGGSLGQLHCQGKILRHVAASQVVVAQRMLSGGVTQLGSTLQPFGFLVGVDLNAPAESIEEREVPARFRLPTGRSLDPPGARLSEIDGARALLDCAVQVPQVVHLAHRAKESIQLDHLDRYMRLALRAQSQCRATCEALAALRNPPVFPRQTNIAVQQVVTNGMILQPSRWKILKIGQTNYWSRMAQGWTLKRRARQGAAIRRWKPWRYSTGPRTVQGKALASRNRYRGGNRRVQRQISKLLKDLRAALQLVMD